MFNPVAPYGYLRLLTCICLLLISKIQTRLFKVAGPELVSTSSAFERSGVSHPVGPYGWLAQSNNGISSPNCWGKEGSTQFVQKFVTAVTAPPLVGSVVFSSVLS